jgi:hypothetical protein
MKIIESSSAEILEDRNWVTLKPNTFVEKPPLKPSLKKSNPGQPRGTVKFEKEAERP